MLFVTSTVVAAVAYDDNVMCNVVVVVVVDTLFSSFLFTRISIHTSTNVHECTMYVKRKIKNR